VKLDGEQLVLDTNILVHWLRGKDAGTKLKADYDLGGRRPRPIIPVVVKAEIKSLALQFGWGDDKQKSLDGLLRELPVADISSEAVIQEYAIIDQSSRKLGRRMGKNDLWIAALASVQEAAILTTDQDFDHLNPKFVKVEYVDGAALLGTAPSG
jgi:tRNA(fMet)-specific endonuclease VapC